MPLIKICINILCKLNEFLYLCISIKIENDERI